MNTRLADALVDRYRIEREVGQGGMATVYLAHDLKHQRDVAIKVLKPELGAVLGVERFLSEIKVTANLQHPNLLPLFESGEVEGLLYYVMPFVEGETLRARLEREKQLPVEEAVRLSIAIAQALDYAHRRGVIHRDLKPENILLADGQPLVADFDIALAVSNAGGQRVTQTGLSLGTPQYMSPEQATGERTLDARTDVYSLGAMTYEMLTGEPPHSGATAQAIIAKLMTEDVRPLTVLRRSVPAHIDAAVRHALEKLAADRFATAGDTRWRCRAKVMRSRSRATPRPRLVRTRPWHAARTRSAKPQRGPSPSRPSRHSCGCACINPPCPKRRWCARSSNHAVPTVNEIAPALSPDGKWLAYSSDESGRFEVYVRPYPEVNSGRWPVSQAGGLQPVWSRNGRELFYQNAAKMLISAAVLPGATFTLGAQVPLFNTSAFVSNSSAVNYDVTPDGQRFVFLRPLALSGAERAAALVQITNWAAEVREKLTGKTP